MRAKFKKATYQSKTCSVRRAAYPLELTVNQDSSYESAEDGPEDGVGQALDPWDLACRISPNSSIMNLSTGAAGTTRSDERAYHRAAKDLA